MNDAFPSLSDVEEFFWNQLAAGVATGRHPWHLGVLATLGDSGPDARMVVLRGCDREAGTVTFHTDKRSVKWTQIVTNPKVSWVFYDAAQAVQLRIAGHATPASTEETIAIWNAMPDRCLRSYATLQPPGSDQPDGGSGLGEAWSHGEPEKSDCAWMLDHFGVVRVTIHQFDFLHLRAAGHQRARWTKPASLPWESTWLTP